MPDKLTDNEIVKAKAHFEYGIKCDIFQEPVLSYAKTVLEAFDEINRLQAERDAWKETAETSEKAYEEWHRAAELNAMKIIELQAENEVLKARLGVYETCNARKDEAIKHLESEVKRLQAENERLEKEAFTYKIRWAKAEVRETKAKAEAYKECIEKANEIIDLIVDLMFDGNVSKCQLPSCHKPSSIPCESEICIQENKEYWHSKLDNILKELVGDK